MLFGASVRSIGTRTCAVRFCRASYAPIGSSRALQTHGGDLHAFNLLAARLGLKITEDWYSVTKGDLYGVGATLSKNLLRKCNYCLPTLLETVQPHVKWEAWRFNMIWQHEEYHKLLFDALARKLRVRCLDDWYSVSIDDIHDFGGRVMLQSKYANSPYIALCHIYPSYDWKVWHFSKLLDLWEDMAGIRAWFDYLASFYNVKLYVEWYNITQTHIIDYAGTDVLKKLGCAGNLSKALSKVYPEYRWSNSFFSTRTDRYPSNPVGLLPYMDALGGRLGVRILDDWHKISFKDLSVGGGMPLLNRKFDESLFTALSTVYPNYKWRFWQFRKPRNFWADTGHQRKYFEAIGEDIGIVALSDWYNVTYSTISKYKILGLLNHKYNGCLSDAIIKNFPEKEWEIRSFKRMPRGYWKDKDNVIAFVKNLADAYNIREPQDWYRVSRTQMLDKKAGNLKSSPHWPFILQHLYPEFKWDWNLFQQSKEKKASQRWVLELTKDIFPNLKVIEEHVVKGRISLDIFVPKHNLGIEYQGEHHYHDLWQIAGKYDTHDKHKKRVCETMGITVVPIPYWWPGDVHSLAATIRHFRPDIDVGAIPASCKPVVSIPQNKYFVSEQKIQAALMQDDTCALSG